MVDDVGDHVGTRVRGAAGTGGEIVGAHPVHEDPRHARLGDDSSHVRVGHAAGDVVDEVCAGCDGLFGDGRAHRVDAHGGAGRGEVAYDGNDPRGLLVRGHAHGPRSGRFAADVDDVGARCDELAPVSHRVGGVEVLTPVGEGVLGDVEDAHHDAAIGRGGCREHARPPG